MKNILSYQNGTTFTGKEIIDWANFQVNNKTSKSRYGSMVLRYYKDTLKSDRKYRVFTRYETAGCNDIRVMPLVIRE